MRPRTLTIGPYGNLDADSVATSQTPAAGGIQELTLDGVLATAGLVTLDFRRQIAITSAGNDSGTKFLITGTDAKGNNMIEVMFGPNIGFVESQRAFTTISSIKVDQDTAGAIQVGNQAQMNTNWLPLDYGQTPFAVGLILDIPVGTTGLLFDVELTMDNLLDFQGNDPIPGRGQHVGSEFDRIFPAITVALHDTMVGINAVGQHTGNIAFPVRAVRFTNGGVQGVNDVTLKVVQAHHGP